MFKRVLLGALLIVSNSSYAVTYYFSSSSGNDGYTSQQAQSPNTPWKTIDKLNSFFTSLSAGDSVLFKRGDVFVGSIIASKSGAVFAPIAFGAYGTGTMPQLNGFTTVSGWRSVGNGLYEAPCNIYGNNVILNGAQQPIGRYPNKGYLSFESHNANSSITDNQLTSAVNWTGGEVVIRKDRWTLDRSLITSHSGTTISYATGTSATPNDGYGYFIQKHAKTLDQEGEWFYDESRKVLMMFFGTKNPSACVVKASTTTTLVSIQNQNYLTFENLSFVGAGKNALHLKNAQNITVSNCLMDFTGEEAILAGWSTYVTLQNSTINHSLSGGINLDHGCHYTSIVNNQFKNTGLLAGLGRSGSGTYEAVTSFGDNARIEKNRIDSTGYNGIYFGGNSSVVKNNYITTFCTVKDDGAGIYVGDWNKWYNKKILDNIIINGVGVGEGTNYPSALMAEGIYIDDLSESVTITGNTISQCNNNGIKIHNAKDVNVFNNIVYNNNVQLRLEQDHYIPQSTYIRNNNIKNNIFFSKDVTQNTSLVSSHQDDIVEFGQLDSNSYSRPLQDISTIATTIVRNGNWINQSYDLAGWKSAYGKDAKSTKSPLEIPGYKVSRLIGANKLVNGSFASNVDGLYWYSTVGDCAGSFVSGTLDGGALKLAFNGTPNNQVIVNIRTGSVAANKKYILKFTILGTGSEKSVKTYLRNTGAPYGTISDVKTTTVGTNRTENEVLLTSTGSDSDASVIFDFIQPSGQVYIDNVELYEAEVTKTNPEEYLLFEYNASNFSKNITLSRPYVDVYNNTYTKAVTIKPFSSVVLIAAGPVTAATDEIAKIAQTISFVDLPATVYANTPLTINATSSSGLPVTLKVVSGPATVSGNTLSFSSAGSVTIEAYQSGNEKFEAATATAQIVNSVKTSQTISFPNLLTTVNGTTQVTINAVASSGLPVTLKVLSGPGILAGNILTFNEAGTVTIEASQAGSDKFGTVTTTVAITNGAKAAQSIIFANLQTQVYDSTPVAIHPITSSGLPVTYKILSGPGTMGGNVVSFTGFGKVIIEVSQAGNDKFAGVTTTIEIINSSSSKTAQTIAFNGVPTLVYTNTPVAINATASSGLAVTLKVISGPGVLAGNVLTFTGVGTVTVQATQAGTDKIETATATVQITYSAKASQTIAFTGVPATVYTNAPVTIMATASSGLAVTLKVISGPGLISGNILSFSGYGIVTVQATQAGNDKIEAAATTTQITYSAKTSQTIAFTGVPATVYTNAPVTINVSASSGLPVTLKVVSGPGVISGNSLSFTGLGTVIVQATQSGTDKIEAASATTQIAYSAKTSQTITFAGVPSTVYTNSPVIINATATSGLAVTLKVVSGPGLISGNILSFTGTGTVTVQATQAGTDKIEAASATIQITYGAKTAQTIVFAGVPTTVYSNTPLPVNASASSGLPVALKVVSGPGLISGNILSFTGTGTVTVEATQAGTDKIESATATIQITYNTKASQTITFVNLPGTIFNGTPVTLNVVASSGLPVAIKVVSGPGVISGNVLSFNGSGIVALQATQAGNEKFEAAFATAKITNSTKVSQTITFVNLQTISYAGAPVALHTFASSGLPVELDVVSGPGALTNNVLVFSGYGKVIIEATQAGNDKFEAVSKRVEVVNLLNESIGLTALATPVSSELKAYPNPFSSVLTLDFITSTSGSGTLMLYNLQGRLIHQIYAGEIKANQTQTFTIDGNNIGLQEGIYLVRLSVGKEALYQKVIFDR